MKLRNVGVDYFLTFFTVNNLTTLILSRRKIDEKKKN